jgi:hypothetical protein
MGRDMAIKVAAPLLSPAPFGEPIFPCNSLLFPDHKQLVPWCAPDDSQFWRGTAPIFPETRTDMLPGTKE